MKQYLYILLSTVLLAGCAKDPLIEEVTPGDGKTIKAAFTLSPEFVEQIDVRSADGVNENAVNNVWVIQLAQDGLTQLQAPQYIITQTDGSRDYKVSVSLQRSASKVYFIANTNSNTAYLDADTEPKVLAVTRAINIETDLVSVSKNIPMAGIWSGTPDLIGISGRVSLSRAVSKVNFTLNANLPGNERFILKSVTVKQVANILQYYRDAATTTPYPTLAKSIDYPATTYDESLSSPKSLWWYLPENARGTVSGVTSQTDKAAKAPDAYCTYIEVKGRYEAGGGTYETNYKIYLGANNTNDYNLKRNTVYNVNTTILGIDAADTRINTVDKTIIVGMFGGWDGTQYTKLLEVQSVEVNKDQKIPWSKDQISTNAKEIYYGVTNIETLRKLSSDLSNYPAAYECAKLGNGWYLPSQNQLMGIWVAYNAIPSDFKFYSDNYWTSNENGGSYSWYISFNDGMVDYNGYKVSNGFVRCVRDITPITTSQSMVATNGNYVVIDSRSLPANAITMSPKALNTTETNDAMTTNNTDKDLASAESNKTVSSYFAVSKIENHTSSTWINAYSICKNYDSSDGSGKWRLPTQRELMLMWILNKQITTITTGVESFGAGGHWCSTEYNNTNSWYVNFGNGHTSRSTPTKSGSLRVRCVRDLTPNEVTVNHLEWATGNLVADGKGGCKIGAPTDGGLYFQFGSLVGWSGGANGDGTGRGTDLLKPTLEVKVQPKDCVYASADWASIAKIWQGTTGTVPQSAPGTTGTNGIGDPCQYYLGGIWRLPTQAECNALFGQTPAFTGSLDWGNATATVGWEKGGLFTPADYGVAKHTKSGMQLPAAGYRINNAGVLTSVGVRGNYWSASPNGLYLNFYSTGVTPNNGSTRDNGFPVRCVRNAR